MNNTLVRFVLACLALEAGVCMAFVADSWAPLRHSEESLFRFVLGKMRGGPGFVIDAPQQPHLVARTRVVRPLEPGEPLRFLHIGVQDPDRELESFPPSPIDWAGMLTNARQAGYQVAAIEQPLTWEEAGELRLNALDTALDQFERAVLTVDLRRGPSDQPIPDFLARGAIPLSNLRGRAGTLPRVNRVVFPPSATGAPSAQFSFRLLESEETTEEDEEPPLPAIARWGDHLIPAFPVAVAMAQHQITPEEVTVEPGRYLRLGNGPIIPIDEFGRFRFEPTVEPENPETIPTDIVRASMIDSIRELTPDGVPRSAVFTDATSGNPSPWTDPAHLQQLLNSIDALPHPSAPEPHERLDPFLEGALLTIIALVAAVLAGRRRGLRVMALTVITLGSLAVLALLLDHSQKWTLVAPVLATCLVGAFLATRMGRYLSVAPPPPEQPASDPEPDPLTAEL